MSFGGEKKHWPVCKREMGGKLSIFSKVGLKGFVWAELKYVGPVCLKLGNRDRDIAEKVKMHQG